jgi:hypothetical protein
MNKEFVGGEIVGEEEAPIETGDHFVKDKEPPQIIRTDFEGYEYEIFRGMTKNTQKRHCHSGRVASADSRKETLLTFSKFSRITISGFDLQFSKKKFQKKVLENLMKKGGDKMPIVAADLHSRA